MKPSRLLLGVVAAVASLGAHAGDVFTGIPPPYFPYIQGYPDGRVYGWFFGMDVDLDGRLTTSEVVNFQFAFEANDGSSFATLAVPVKEIFADGGGMSFVLGGSVLGDDEGEFISAKSVTSFDTWTYKSGPDGGVFDSTVAGPGWQFLPQVTLERVQVLPFVGVGAIPEPATDALMLGGLLALLAVHRLRSV